MEDVEGGEGASRTVDLGTWPVLGRSWRGRQMEAIGWHCIELRRGTAWKGTVEWAENARCPNALMQVRGVEVCF